MPGPLSSGAGVPMLATPCKPATMLDAPKRMKHPNMTVIARRISTLPPSAMNPTLATAITATVVETVPSKVPSSHLTAATIALEPAGSKSEADVDQVATI